MLFFIITGGDFCRKWKFAVELWRNGLGSKFFRGLLLLFLFYVLLFWKDVAVRRGKKKKRLEIESFF